MNKISKYIKTGMALIFLLNSCSETPANKDVLFHRMYPNYSQVDEGMTKNQVRTIMGKPTSVTDGGGTSITYCYVVPGRVAYQDNRGGRRVNFCKKTDKVVSFSPTH